MDEKCSEVVKFVWQCFEHKFSENHIRKAKYNLNQSDQEKRGDQRSPTEMVLPWKVKISYEIILLIYYKFSTPHTTSTKD